MKIRLDDLIVLLSAGVYVYRKVDNASRGIFSDGAMNVAISNVMKELKTINLGIVGDVTPEIKEAIEQLR